MDSLTHAAIGACLGEALLSKKVGRRALLWGALAQNLPDIDTVAALWLPPHQNLLVHRGITHSFLLALIMAVLLTLVAGRWHQKRQIPWPQFFLFFLLQLLVHDLLDACNAYGTGLLLPFSSERFSFHLLYVADPLFSLWPCLGALALLLFRKASSGHRLKWALWGLVPAGLYLGYAVFNRQQVQSHLEASLRHRQLKAASYFVTPTPFNNWLWYAVVATDTGYYIGYRSVFWPAATKTVLRFYPQQEKLLTPVDNPGELQDLRQFASGFYTVERWNDTLVLNVLRFGQMLGWQEEKARFTFHYFLQPARADNRLVMQRGRMRGWNWETLHAMGRLIFVAPEQKFLRREPEK
ncbi:MULTISPECIES: metal-dependent hydrolase [Rufibacter]|uniref:Inner membrane protein n=1 Tax=Rufibacter quisquiliarum TaxID=1549639 RepID=A0A839GEK9_9BACT|nr:MULTISPECIES: metal-dependent hydrolase [Rufibacter]MBA9075973.1 inner membrane protein [Rufibacter quisquiliarum]